MPPKSRICRAATSWPGWLGQPGVEDALDRRVPVEEGGDRARVLASGAPCGRRASSGRGARASSRTGPGTAPSDFCRNLRRSAIVGSFVAAKPADDVRVAAEVLRRRVDDDVGAELERALQVRRRERVVDDDERAGRVGGRRRARGCRSRSAAGSSASRARRGASARRGARSSPAPISLGREELEAVALRLVDLREHAVDAAVDVVHAERPGRPG